MASTVLGAQSMEKHAVKLRDERIEILEEQLRDLMVHIEAQKTVDETAPSDVKGGTVLVGPAASSSSTVKSSRHGSRNRRRS